MQYPLPHSHRANVALLQPHTYTLMNAFQLFDKIAIPFFAIDRFLVAKIIKPIISKFENLTGFTPTFVAISIMYACLVNTFFSAIKVALNIANFAKKQPEHLGSMLITCIVLMLFEFKYIWYVNKLAHHRYRFREDYAPVLDRDGLIEDKNKMGWLTIIPLCIAVQHDSYPLLQVFAPQFLPLLFFYPALCVASVPTCSKPEARRVQEGKRVVTIFIVLILLVVFLLSSSKFSIPLDWEIVLGHAFTYMMFMFTASAWNSPPPRTY